jgi:hypothetical protein
MGCCEDQPGRTYPITLLTPYLVGAGIGVLCWIVFAVVNQPTGVSTALSQASGAAAEASLGKVRLPEMTGVPDRAWFAALAVTAVVGSWLLERKQPVAVPATVKVSPGAAPAVAAPEPLPG